MDFNKLGQFVNSNTIITLNSDKLHVHISYSTNVLKVVPVVRRHWLGCETTALQKLMFCNSVSGNVSRAAAAGTPLARRRSLGSHSRRNNEFGASQTAILVSILTQIEWQRRAQSYVCWETTCGSVTTRWDNSCLREDVITERAVWQERKAKRVVVAVNVFCMGSVVCLYNCMRMTIWTYYWVSYR